MRGQLHVHREVPDENGTLYSDLLCTDLHGDRFWIRHPNLWEPPGPNLSDDVQLVPKLILVHHRDLSDPGLWWLLRSHRIGAADRADRVYRGHVCDFDDGCDVDKLTDDELTGEQGHYGVAEDPHPQKDDRGGGNYHYDYGQDWNFSEER